jgi:hypothetical protein
VLFATKDVNRPIISTRSQLLARSARGGWGKCGCASGVSMFAVACGFEQVTAQRREANFGRSHIFPHPAEVLAIAHPQ